MKNKMTLTDILLIIAVMVSVIATLLHPSLPVVITTAVHIALALLVSVLHIKRADSSEGEREKSRRRKAGKDKLHATWHEGPSRRDGLLVPMAQWQAIFNEDRNSGATDLEPDGIAPYRAVVDSHYWH